MRAVFAKILASILIISTTIGMGRLLGNFFHNPYSLLKTPLILGEEKKVLLLLSVFHSAILFFLGLGLMWVLVESLLLPLTLGLKFLISLCMICTSVLISFVKKNPDSDRKQGALLNSQSAQAALLEWRLKLLFTRNRMTQFCFFLVLPCSLMLGAAAFLSYPFVTAFVLSFSAGFLANCALCFQFAEDIESSRLEKSSGVTHRSFLIMLFSVSFIVGSILGSLNFLIWWLGHLGGADSFGEALRVFFISALPSCLLPSFLFQIEARRPLLSIMVSFLVSLFVTTAIYANWLFLGLIPLIIYYGFTSQEGRFYRA